MKPQFGLLLAVLAAWLGGCASPVPEPIRQTAPNSAPVRVVQQDPQRHVGSEVRWGGNIIAVENRQDATWVFVLSRPLANDGEPRLDATPLGRFIAVLEGFHEPTVYEEGRALTVRGPIREVITRQVGEYPYRYPLVEVNAHYLWSEPARRDSYYYDPWFYDPWYYPYYSPFYRHPYWW